MFKLKKWASFLNIIWIILYQEKKKTISTHKENIWEIILYSIIKQAIKIFCCQSLLEISQWITNIEDQQLAQGCPMITMKIKN